ncbi:MAG: hypothetical protein R3Y32_01525 [Bacillota bacterium]
MSNANGPCEKICVELKRVFDACMKQGTLENVLVTVSDLSPESPEDPLKFVSAFSKGTTTLDNLVITPIEGRPCHARVRADATIKMQVNYTDANCCPGEGTTDITVPIDVVLAVPQASILPYDISAVCGLVAPTGTYESDDTFKITICYTLIVKVTMDVELVVPTYGYCRVPQCQDYNEEVCTDFFELPLYPRMSQR